MKKFFKSLFLMQIMQYIFITLFLLLAITTAALGAYPVPTIVSDKGLTDHATFKAGYLDATWYDNWTNGGTTYHVDKTGVVDSTIGLNKAISDAYNAALAVYLPLGTYKVSNTIFGVQVVDTWTDDLSGWTMPNNYIVPVILEGETTGGSKPVIALAAGSSGFNNPSVPKPVIHFYCWNPADPPGDFEGEVPSFAFGLVIRGIKVQVGASNSGAIGIRMFSAQDSHLDNIEVDLSNGGYAGIYGASHTSVNTNITVTGGQYGIYPRRTGGLFTNVTLTNQTEAAFIVGSGMTLGTLTGFTITKASGPAIITGTTHGTQSFDMSLYDGSINITGGSTVAIDNSASGANLYARNVYVKNPGPLVQSHNLSAISSSGNWDRIVEYSNSDPDPYDSYGVSTYTLIEGVSTLINSTALQEAAEIHNVTLNAGTPPTDLASRHGFISVPKFYDPDAVNVLNLGAKGDGVTDDTTILQNAINSYSKIFLPRGQYNISGTLTLKKDTQIYGVPIGSRLYRTSSWTPTTFTPFIDTVDSATGTAYIGNIAINLPGGTTDPISLTYLTGMKWRVGRHSMVYQVRVKPAYSTDQTSYARRLYQVVGSGGGRWFGIQPDCLSMSRTWDLTTYDFAIIGIEGTSEPITLYGPNPEKTQLHFIVKNAANVRVPYLKTEGSEMTRIVNSNNVMWLGNTGSNGDNYRKYLVDNSTNVLIANAGSYASVHTIDEMIREQNMSNSQMVDGINDVSIYKRGTFNDAVFPYCGDGVLSPWYETSATCPADAAFIPSNTLRINASNNKQFLGVDGRPLVLFGHQIFMDMHDNMWGSDTLGLSGPQYGLNWAWYLDFLTSRKINFIRGWSSMSPSPGFLSDPNYPERHFPTSPMPYKRTGPGNATDGGLKFNLDTTTEGWNEEYFTRLASRVSNLQARGIYISFCFFDVFDFGPYYPYTGSPGSNWDGNIFKASNNVQALNTDADSDGCAIEEFFISPNTTILNYQKAFIAKVLDTLNDYNNVMYEIVNELGYTTWQTTIKDYIKNYEAGKPKQHLVVISAGAQTTNCGAASDMTKVQQMSLGADVNSVTSSWTSLYKTAPPIETTYIQPLIMDMDHIAPDDNIYNKSYILPWKAFTRGYHYVLYDKPFEAPETEDTTWDLIRKDIGLIASYNTRFVDLGAMVPSTTVSSTTYCLSYPGEYMVLQPSASGGSFTVSIIAGKYNYEWIRLSTGSIHSTGTFIQDAAGNKTFNTNDVGVAEPMALYIYPSTPAPSFSGVGFFSNFK